MVTYNVEVKVKYINRLFNTAKLALGAYILSSAIGCNTPSRVSDEEFIRNYSQRDYTASASPASEEKAGLGAKLEQSKEFEAEGFDAHEPVEGVNPKEKPGKSPLKFYALAYGEKGPDFEGGIVRGKLILIPRSLDDNLRFNFYADGIHMEQRFDEEEKEGDGSEEDIFVDISRYGGGLGRYFKIGQNNFGYLEANAFHERYNFGDRVDVVRENNLFGGKAGFVSRATGTKVLARALGGTGTYTGDFEKNDFARILASISAKQKVAGPLYLVCGAGYDIKDYKALLESRVFAAEAGPRVEIPLTDYLMLVPRASATARVEDDKAEGQRNEKDVFYGTKAGVTFVHKNIALDAGYRYDEELGHMGVGGVRLSFGF